MLVKRLAMLTVSLLLCAVMAPFAVHAADAIYGGDPYHFGFKKSRNQQLASINEEGFKDIIQKNEAIFLGDVTQKELYLTFDNGYENGYTGRILDVLKEHKVPAIFFVTGHFVKDRPELVKRMVEEGHLIGNHSWSHPDMSQISNERLREELEKVQAEVGKLTSQKEMHYLRPPRGIFNNRILAESKSLGYTSVFWSVAYRDWDPKTQKGWKYAYDNVMSQLHPGAVILLHSVSSDNAEALGRIIAAAKEQGYEFKSLDQMQKKTY
ncbi:delta-lactam-biosynthetic de-N-acetylase [Paenibacillus sp. OAS669]|uniref:delta-lactam-biosynthetic de-N-acetylase n=1 Tax=Paenibacillus sp. OAS669 TaxID=2663821 RepID=UPI001788F3E6|nr:delta-lactam-biosynthetic de-N-acetylase [Paenibacillus sp. OAS669]MBE1443683.1 peptidoglycan-N-acetylmuramic acid deacetylase [Paenibacillus sp. OAS669]